MPPTDATTEQALAPPTDERATRTDRDANAVSLSMLISGIRCSLTYVVFPWLLPLLGLAAGIGSTIGIVVGLVAIVFNLASIRRMWRADHRLKWPVTILNASVIVLLVVLVALDVTALA